MEVSVEKTTGLERRMTVSVPSAEIEQEVNARLVKVGRTAKLKGFRPGKVPAKVVRQRFGGQVRQEVLTDVINSSFSKAIEQEQLNPAGGPSIEPSQNGADSAEQFSYIATFEVFPEVELGELSKLKVERVVVDIGDKDVDDMLERLRKQRADWQTVDRKAADGDQVTLDFQGSIDGEAFQGGEGQDVTVVLGEGQFLPDLEKALKGVSAGDEKSAKVKFPKDYPADEVAGKKAVFELQVKSVAEQVLPEFDETFFAAFGVTDGGMDALKAEVQGNMERELKDRQRQQVKGQVLDSLVEHNPLEVPNSLVHSESHSMQHEAMRRLGVTDHADAPGLENFEEPAKRRVVLSLLIQELIRSEEIELDRKRVESRLQEIAEPYEQAEEVVRMYRGNEQLMSQLSSGVLEEQVVDHLLERAQVKDKTMKFSDFMAL